MTRGGSSSLRHPARQGGYTLVELMVALVAGLSVAMAVVGVSKEATNTFHEEARVSGAEMGLRVAMERLRMDLQRAAFMSTGNILGDPLVARSATYTGTLPNLSNMGANIPYSMQTLAGIRLNWGGATIGPGHEANGIEAQNGLTPDSIDIGGNFSTADEYVATIVWPTVQGGASAPCAAGPAISLQMNTPAAWRIVNAETIASAATGYVAGQELQAAFHPGPSTTSQFLLRLTDQTGRYQYLMGAAGGVGVGTVYNASGPTATICLSTTSTILQTSATGGLGGVSGFGTGWVVVSPVQIVRWDVMSVGKLQNLLSAASVTSQYWYGVTATPDANDFALVRSYLDFSLSNCSVSAPCPPDYSTSEVVAEYAVDLKFGFIYDGYQNPNCTAAGIAAGTKCPLNAPSYTTSTIKSVSMDSASAQAAVTGYALLTPPTYTPNQGPQRIRSVLARVGLRTRFPDRQLSLSVSSTPTVSPSNYIYRYQTATSVTPGSGALAFARVRESTTEVALPNQVRFYY